MRQTWVRRRNLVIPTTSSVLEMNSDQEEGENDQVTVSLGLETPTDPRSTAGTGPWNANLWPIIPSDTSADGWNTPAPGETPYLWDKRDVADLNEFTTGLTPKGPHDPPKGHILSFTAGSQEENTLISLGENVFGIPSHSPTNGESRPRTPPVQPSVPLPMGSQVLGARPKDSLTGLVNNTNKVKKSDAGTQLSLLGATCIEAMRSSSLSSINWPGLPGQEGIQTSAPSQNLPPEGVMTYSNMTKVKEVKEDTTQVDPEDLVLCQNKLHHKISGLGTKLSKNNCKVDSRKIMKDVKKSLPGKWHLAPLEWRGSH